MSKHINSREITNEHISDNARIEMKKIALDFDTNIFEIKDDELKIRPNTFLKVDGDGQNAGDITVENITIDSNYFKMKTNDRANILIGKGDRFEPTEVFGVLSIDHTGKTFIKDQSMANKHFSTNAADRLDISKTTLSLSDDFQWKANDRDVLEIKENFLRRTGGDVRYLTIQPLTTSPALLEVISDTNTSTLSIKNNQAEWNFANLVTGNLELNDGAGNNILTFDKNTKYVGVSLTGLPSEHFHIGGNLKVEGAFKMLDNTDGKFLLAKNGSYKPVTMTGAVSIDKDGITTYNNRSIESSKLKDEIITDIKISPKANISMSKTNFTPSNKFIYNGINGSLEIKDLYLMKNTEGGSSDINDLTTTGDYTRLTDSKIGDYKGDGNGIYMDWYKERNNNISYQQGFLGATDDVVSFKNFRTR